MSEVVSVLRTPLIDGTRSLAEIDDDVLGPLERRPTLLWWLAIAASSTVLLVGLAAIAYELALGIGTWGANRTVGWGFDITNFVFWVGIGHAGTLISAILLLFRQKWRTSVNRAAEAMTIFAVMCAALYPIIHMGRPWLAFWNLPYPNSRSLWLNFRSPLLWDVFAISTYFTISALFWYTGLVPDLATLRDRAPPGLRRSLYRLLALGWDGSARTWSRYETLCLLMAGLATPLVVSVHTVVSMDFATSILPGWHTTILPPYFVAGAIFSGFAMVLTLMIIARKVMGFERYITARHIDVMCKVMVANGCLVGFAYATELFMAWYSGNEYERFTFENRIFGPFAWTYWIMVTCNVVLPQLLWFKAVRRTIPAVFALSIVVNIGMWFERFVIIVGSLQRDYLPSAWATYAPSWTEIATFVGTFGLFFTLFLLFCRFLPMIAVAEVKAVANYARPPQAPRVEGGAP